MTVVLLNGAEPFEQIIKTLTTEENLVKIARALSEKKTFKTYTILYIYIAPGVEGR